MVAESLSLWSPWNSADGIRQLLLHFTDGSIESLQPVSMYCDMPFTTTIGGSKKLKKVASYDP